MRQPDERYVEQLVPSGRTVSRGGRTLDARNLRCIETLTGHMYAVSSVAIAGDVVVSGSRDNMVKVWLISTGSCITTLTGHTNTVLSVAIAGDVLVSGSHDLTVKLWST